MIHSTSWAYRRAWTDLKHMTIGPQCKFHIHVIWNLKFNMRTGSLWCLSICCSSFHYTSSSCCYFTGAHVRLMLTHRFVLPYLCLLEDDVDLEALVNEMDSSLESLYSCSGPQTESTPLLHNGRTSTSHSHHHQAHQHNQPRQGQHSHGISHISPEPPSSSSDSPQTGLRRSQPMHINAVR